MSLKKTQQGVASICVRGTHLGFFPLCGGSGEGRRGKSETSCGYWHTVAGTVEPHWRPEASLPLQSHQDRERTRGKGHWDHWAVRILRALLMHRSPKPDSNITRETFENIDSQSTHQTYWIRIDNYEATDACLGNSLESGAFMIEPEKLKLRKDHNLPTDSGKIFQKPEHLLPAQNSPIEVSLLLSKLFISTSSTVPVSRHGPIKLQSSNQKLGSYHHSPSPSTWKPRPLLLILPVNSDWTDLLPLPHHVSPVQPPPSLIQTTAKRPN